jgi:hypothetical protein
MDVPRAAAAALFILQAERGDNRFRRDQAGLGHSEDI